MAALARIARFGAGSILGAAIGGVAAYFMAPQSGSQLTANVRTRIEDAKLAGDEAKAVTEQALIQRFQGRVNDTSALADVSTQLQQERVARAAAVVARTATEPGV